MDAITKDAQFDENMAVQSMREDALLPRSSDVDWDTRERFFEQFGPAQSAKAIVFARQDAECGRTNIRRTWGQFAAGTNRRHQAFGGIRDLQILAQICRLSALRQSMAESVLDYLTLVSQGERIESE